MSELDMPRANHRNHPNPVGCTSPLFDDIETGDKLGGVGDRGERVVHDEHANGAGNGE
jgi:hypothetical protein